MLDVERRSIDRLFPMRHSATSIILLLSALFGVLAQAHARTRIPQPSAMAAKLHDGASGHRGGMEPASDLFGEAAASEEDERVDRPWNLLELIAMKGWTVAFIVAEPFAPETAGNLTRVAPRSGNVAHLSNRVVPPVKEPPRTRV